MYFRKLISECIIDWFQINLLLMSFPPLIFLICIDDLYNLFHFYISVTMT